MYDPEFEILLVKYQDEPGVLAYLWSEKIHSNQHELGLVNENSCPVCHDSRFMGQ